MVQFHMNDAMGLLYCVIVVNDCHDTTVSDIVREADGEMKEFRNCWLMSSPVFSLTVKPLV